MTKGYLLDTNVISEILKKRPFPGVLRRVREARGERLATSAVCVAELRFGAARHPSGRTLWQRLSRDVLDRIRILPLGFEEAVRAGEVLATLEARGKTLGIEDVLIGATALEHGLTLVTRNLKHFRRIEGLAVESWWEARED